jgi:pimeloyl-ACP methyl ester carboxylesterase
MIANELLIRYNNEHGPTRLRLSSVTTGKRYIKHVPKGDSAVVSSSPPWIAIYDIIDMAWLQSQEYLSLRAPPVKSQREINVMKQIIVDRRLFETVSTHSNPGFKLQQGDEQDTALVEVLLDFREGSDSDEQVEQFISQVATWTKAVSGWEQVRNFRFERQVVILISVTPEALDSSELHEAMKSTFTSAEFDSVIATKTIRMWKLYYVFGPAPRHLSQEGEIIVHYGTRSIPASKSSIGIAALESFVTLPDGLNLPFRLEGSTNPSAPVIVLVNSVMVHYDIWDDFVAAFFAHKSNGKYRVLRFLPRGRFAPTRFPAKPSQQVTVDLLASDIVGLLDALEIKQAECVMGVSLGGATALRAALLYPSRFKSFVSCDTNASAPAGNSKAWGERIAIAETEGAAVTLINGPEAVIGEQLAEVTVKRWAVPESYEKEELAKRLRYVKEGVKVSSLEGFKEQVQALYEYDFWSDMKSAKTKGIFVVGAGDGALPAGMKKMADGYGTGTTLHVVDKAGHLPMVEKPKEVAQILTDFINT